MIWYPAHVSNFRLISLERLDARAPKSLSPTIAPPCSYIARRKEGDRSSHELSPPGSRDVNVSLHNWSTSDAPLNVGVLYGSVR